MRVIVTDVDNTLVCTEQRRLRCLEHTQGKFNADFWNLFLSDQYVDLDVPIWPTFSLLYNIHKRTRLPVVIVTGRHKDMRKGNEMVKSLIKDLGIELADEFYKDFGDFDTVNFKIEVVRKSGYFPEIIFEDDKSIAKSFKDVFGSTVYLVVDCKYVMEF